MINKTEILSNIDCILQKETEKAVILKNICNLLHEKVHHYDWVGFYELDSKSDTLILSEYTGKPTEHTQIKVGNGVCGQVAASNSTIVVQDVNSIENYISCSIDVQSEIVVPIKKNGKFIAEIDIDSHAPAPFTKDDEELLEEICDCLSELY